MWNISSVCLRPRDQNVEEVRGGWEKGKETHVEYHSFSSGLQLYHNLLSNSGYVNLTSSLIFQLSKTKPQEMQNKISNKVKRLTVS